MRKKRSHSVVMTNILVLSLVSSLFQPFALTVKAASRGREIIGGAGSQVFAPANNPPKHQDAAASSQNSQDDRRQGVSGVKMAQDTAGRSEADKTPSGDAPKKGRVSQSDNVGAGGPKIGVSWAVGQRVGRTQVSRNKASSDDSEGRPEERRLYAQSGGDSPVKSSILELKKPSSKPQTGDEGNREKISDEDYINRVLDGDSGQNPSSENDIPKERGEARLHSSKPSGGQERELSKPSGLIGSASSGIKENPPEARAGGQGPAGQIPIKIGRNKQRGVNVNHEVPSVRHVTMSPASKRFGGDDVEIGISPIYDVLIQMPEQVEYYRSSSGVLSISAVASNPNMIALKLSPVDNVLPMSLHIVDVQQNIYTFTIIGMPADLAWEYPKTIIVNRRLATKTALGAKNPRSVIDAMDVDDAIQIVVGDVPKTSEYTVELVSGKYQHYEGYVQYAFRMFRTDKASINPEDLKFTIWANDKRLDAGNAYSSSRNVEWTIEPILSRRESRRNGYDVLRVFVQIRASILDLEEWTNAFVTVSDKVGYSRQDFTPIIRPFRAPRQKTEE